MVYNLTYKTYGNTAVLVEWPAQISELILNDILKFKRKIENHSINGVYELRSAYQSLLVVFDTTVLSFDTLVLTLKTIYKKTDESIAVRSKLWTIPVCYDTEFGIDLDVIAEHKQLTISEIVKRHTAQIYTVYFVGFLPGFLYLGGLDNSLAIPRKATPSLQIASGSVAIGGNQTGVYPMTSPGGWHIIGNTPISFFNTELTQPCFAQAGDKVKFNSVSKTAYWEIKSMIAKGHYVIEKRDYDG